MQKETKPCSKCGKNPYIVNRTKWLCQYCNFKRLHEGKEVWQVTKQKPIAPSKKRVSVLSKDREFYKLCFDTKLQICEECNAKLPNEFKDENGRLVAIYRYSHIITKKSAPEFRYNPMNINILCLTCHTKWETGNRKEMNIYENNMKIIEELKRGRNERGL